MTRFVVLPGMEGAAQTPVMHSAAEAEVRPEVRAERAEDVRHSFIGAEEHQLLVEVPDRLDLARHQVRGVPDLKPSTRIGLPLRMRHFVPPSLLILGVAP